ncbi:MAG: helix-turn-helix transcriptional regulator [Pseudomonadota bacterium]
MTAFARSLKTWRAARRYSQLDLAGEAGISSRHLSFLETGRARPSRAMVLQLSEALHLPLDARNQLLTHAGFAARYAGRQWSDGAMAPIRQAVERMLDRHMPYPGLAVDRLWTIRQANQTARALFGAFGVGEGDSLLDLMTSDALPAAVENWPAVARRVAARLRLESLAQGGVAAFDRAIAHLAEIEEGGTDAADPVIPTIVHHGDLRLSMFATIAQIGTPEDVTLDDLKVELYFPMDDATAAAFRAMAEA